MDWTALATTVGTTVAGVLFPPAAPLVAGLGKLAGVIGGDAGKKIEDGIKKVSEGLQGVTLTPEQQAQAQAISLEHEQAMAEIGYKREALVYQDQAGGREVIKTALLSDDPVVRQARPLMMKRIGNFCILYAFMVAGLFGTLNLSSKAIDPEMVSAVRWIGGFLFTAFMTSFTGYTIGRYGDKRLARDTYLGAQNGNGGSVLGTVGRVLTGRK